MLESLNDISVLALGLVVELLTVISLQGSTNRWKCLTYMTVVQSVVSLLHNLSLNLVDFSLILLLQAVAEEAQQDNSHGEDDDENEENDDVLE